MNAKCIKSGITRAFSLIELMVVIAIVAVLSAVAVPSYKTYIAQSRVAEITGLIEDQLNQWATNDATQGGSFSDITNGPLGSYILTSVLSDSGGTGTVRVTLCTNGTSGCTVGTDIDTSMSALVITMTPTVVAGTSGDTSDSTINWACTLSDASAEAFIPSIGSSTCGT